MPRKPTFTALICLSLALLAGCGDGPWNNPYQDDPEVRNTFYSSFSTRPKHLDPVRAYSSDEYTFIAQVYEPPLQYHYLHRPYRLVPAAAAAMPEVRLFDADGERLPEGAAADAIAYSEYHITLRDDLRYQPHPAFARDAEGEWIYHTLDAEQLADKRSLGDFNERDSRAVTAADYAHQIKRIAFPSLHSPIRGLMSEHILGFEAFTEAVKEAHERQQGEGFFDLRPFPLEGVEVIDERRYSVRLKGHYPQFVYWLAMPFFSPMPWEAEAFYGQPGMKERNITLDWYPVGSGPFMLSENNPNLRMVLERNPHYHHEAYPDTGGAEDRAAGLLDDSGKTLPLIERAVYSLEKESIPRWNKFLQGWYDTSGIGSDSFDQAVTFGGGGEANLTEAMQERDIQLITAVQSSIFYLGFNMLDPVVGGYDEQARQLRRALSIAIDFEEFISIFLNGRGVAAQGPLPPGIFGHREGVQGINRTVYQVTPQGQHRRPIAEARRLLAEAGYPDGRDPQTGKPLILYYDTTATGPDDKARLNWMRKQFDKLGIELVIRASDYNRFREKMRKGTSQIFMWGWNADYPDPENFFFLLYGPNGKAEHGGENAANYASPAFDALFERMKNMPNNDQRQALIDEMMEILHRDAPWSWGFFPKAFSLHHAWYGNVKPNLMANNTLKYKRIDPAPRDEKRRAWNQPILWPILLILVILAVTSLPAIRIYRRRERSSAL